MTFPTNTTAYPRMLSIWSWVVLVLGRQNKATASWRNRASPDDRCAPEAILDEESAIFSAGHPAEERASCSRVNGRMKVFVITRCLRLVMIVLAREPLTPKPRFSGVLL